MPPSTVTAETQNLVWHEYFSVVRLNRYYTELHQRHRKWRDRLQISLLVIPAGGVLGIIEDLRAPQWVVPIASLLVVGLVCANSIWGLSKKTVVLEVVAYECTRLELKWMHLWMDAWLGRISDKAAREMNRALMDRLNAITDRPYQAGVGEDSDLNEQCQKEAKAIIEQRWASLSAEDAALSVTS